MSEENEKGSKVLIFKPVARRAASAATAATTVSELYGLLATYDRLIALLRETDNEGLDILTDSLVIAVVRCREALTRGMDEKTSLDMMNFMRRELREIPQTLRSILPGIGPRLGESMQHKLGIQFASY
jgi:hypothetical protein